MSAAAAAASTTFGAGTLAGLGGAAWLKFAYGYSRSLWMFDAEFRFDRMQAGYEFANTQQDMFRADLVMMTELTFRKMAIYTVVGTVGMAIYIAIFCAGRLGLHGPSPPVWIMGLFLTNIAFAFTMAGMGIWLGFHAMWRAKAATVHLNTRKVRLMIPTRKKLDEARRYGWQWEDQPKRDLLRVPYVSDMLGHKWSSEVPDVEQFNDERGVFEDDKSGRRASSEPPMKRVPYWIAEEYEHDRAGIAADPGNKAATAAAHTCPEHFRLYMRAQKDWFQFDCYARICMFYSFLSFFQGGSFYGLGQINIELRAWWPAFANNFLFAVLHFLMLKFDIVKCDGVSECLPYAQYAGTLCIPIAAIGMALDFRVEYDPIAIQFTWACIFICYILQIIYGFRLVELLKPYELNRSDTDGNDRMGNMWWPKSWWAPPAFQHVYYFVAPPSRIYPSMGQFDVVRELKEGYYRSSTSQDSIANLEEDLKRTEGFHSRDFSPQGRDEAKRLVERFNQVSRNFQGTQLETKLGEIQNDLRMLKRREGDSYKGDGYDSGSGSGSGSDGSSGYSSASSGKVAYSSDRRAHPELPIYAGFNSAKPYPLVWLIVGTFALTWVVLTFCMVIDRLTGVQGLVTAPHWAKPPMTRSSKFTWERGTPLGLNVYSWDRPLIPEELYWHENVKARTEGWKPHWMDFGHEGRRLAESPQPHSFAAGMGQEAGMKQAFNSLLSSFPTPAIAAELLHRVPTKEEADALTNLESRFRSTGTGWRPQSFTWPGFFEPKLLACASSEDGARHALAITPRGVAAAAQLGGDSGEAHRFVLTGLADYPPLLAASWSPGPKDGLMLVSKMGDLLHCPGTRQGSQWACRALANAPPRLPLAQGSRLAAAASAWLGGTSNPRLHVAVVLENSPDVVALWTLDGNTEAASWLPLGELPVPHRMARGASVAFVNDGELLLATADGATILRRISDGGVVTSTPPLDFNVEKQPTLQWQAACGLHGPKGGLVHLSMRQELNSRRPEVMVLRTVKSGD